MMKRSKILAGYFLYVFSLWLYVIVSIQLSSCSTIKKMQEQHQEKKANTFFNSHPDKDAQRCADHFPLKDSAGAVHIDSFKKADNPDFTKLIDSLRSAWLATDSAINKTDTVFRPWIITVDGLLNQLHSAYKPCKPDTVFKTADHYLVDGAAAAAYAAEKKHSAELQKKLDAANNTNKIRFWMLIAAAAIIILLIVLLFNTVRLKHKLTIPPL